MSSLQKEKRGTISARRRRQLLLLVTELQKLQSKFPEIRADIQDDIDDHLRQAARTRELDRQDVLNSLTNWQGVGSTANDLIEETGLSDRVVRGVLDELQTTDPPRVVVTGERATDGERGRPAKVYDLASV
jgi:hypothetical protein